MPYIMPTKNDACNQFEDCIEITNTDRWLRRSASRATRVSATCTCSSRPTSAWSPSAPASTASWPAGASMRNNIEVVLTVRRSMSTTSNETTIKRRLCPDGHDL
ncbi:MAG: hypothetical protein ACLRRN_07245 [Oscillospiraceae bacterium]